MLCACVYWWKTKEHVYCLFEVLDGVFAIPQVKKMTDKGVKQDATEETGSYWEYDDKFEDFEGLSKAQPRKLIFCAQVCKVELYGLFSAVCLFSSMRKQENHHSVP